MLGVIRESVFASMHTDDSACEFVLLCDTQGPLHVCVSTREDDETTTVSDKESVCVKGSACVSESVYSPHVWVRWGPCEFVIVCKRITT